jgi:hypothetical protein
MPHSRINLWYGASVHALHLRNSIVRMHQISEPIRGCLDEGINEVSEANLPQITPKVPNMWGKCGGVNVLPP